MAKVEIPLSLNTILKIQNNKDVRVLGISFFDSACFYVYG
jgi:hypothetical protein